MIPIHQHEQRLMNSELTMFKIENLGFDYQIYICISLGTIFRLISCLKYKKYTPDKL